MTGSMTVRLATEEDTHRVRVVLRAAEIDEELARRDHYYRYVAVDDDTGAVIGFLDGLFDLPVPDRAAVNSPPGPQAWGNWMVVEPDARARGVGHALVRAFVVKAEKRGCTFFAGMVSHHDDRAARMGFFTQCGMYDLVPGEPGHCWRPDPGHRRRNRRRIRLIVPEWSGWVPKRTRRLS